MSQYVDFFIRHDNGKFISIGDYSRSNPIYQALQYIVPYENATPFTKEIFDEAYNDLTRSIEGFKRGIEDYKKQNTLIATMSDPLNEKLERIAENESSIKELEEEIETYTAQRYYLTLYFDMNDHWEKNEVWVGVEVSASYLNKEDKEETN